MILQKVLELKITSTNFFKTGRKINYINPRYKMTESVSP